MNANRVDEDSILNDSGKEVYTLNAMESIEVNER